MATPRPGLPAVHSCGSGSGAPEDRAKSTPAGDAVADPRTPPQIDYSNSAQVVSLCLERRKNGQFKTVEEGSARDTISGVC